MRANKLPLDDRDRAILRLLQADGRLTNLELAQRINLSPSACLRRVNLSSGDAALAVLRRQWSQLPWPLSPEPQTRP